ncbi:MAG: hypothetical protein RJQ14_21030 [Marinoscillum sp.]
MKDNFDLEKLPEMERRARKKFIIVLILFPIAISIAFDKQLGISDNPILYLTFIVLVILISILIYYFDLKGARSYRTYYIELTDYHLVVSLNNKNLQEIHYSQILGVNLNEYYFNIKTHYKNILERMSMPQLNNRMNFSLNFGNELTKLIIEWMAVGH